MNGAEQRGGMNRREFLGLSAAAAGALCGFGARAAAEAGRGKAKRPNIIFILADDLGWADVGYHGSEIETPNIDRLAERSVRFGRHYVMPTCTPTRVGLMSGRYPSRYGVVSPDYGKLFDDDTVTLAAALGRCGYFTSISGKWHMGSPPECTPRKYGFDSSYGYFDGQIDPYTHRYKNGRRSWHRNDEFLDEEGHATDLITDEAVRVIDEEREGPFFLYVAYSVPHFPLDEPERWTKRYEGRIENESRRWYAASVTHMDHGIGRIVEAVERQGAAEETLIVFASDNGGQKSWHNSSQYKGRYADKPHDVLGDNRPLRGWKGEVYEGGIRVPALASWPGVLEAGQVDTPLHIVDWMPTLCGLAGYADGAAREWDGRDMWPAIAGAGDVSGSRTLYWKTPGAWAVRRGDWKLIARKNSERLELYDVTHDPYEQRDMATERPAKVAELRTVLAEMMEGDR